MVGDWQTYIILSLFWLTFIIITFIYLFKHGFHKWDSGIYAWGLFFIAHFFYELPYMFYYHFFTTYHVSPVILYISFIGCYFIIWFSHHYPKSRKLLKKGIPIVIFFSSLILISAVYLGVNILSGDYGMNVFCWASRFLAVLYTWSIPYNLGRMNIEATNSKL